MRYRIAMTIEVNARNAREAHDYALKLQELLRSPMVKMAAEGAGIQLSGEDGRPTVHQPEPAVR